MTIIKTLEAPNGAQVQWHRVTKVEYTAAGAVAMVSSFTSAGSAQSPSWQWPVVVPDTATGNVLAAIEALLTTDAGSPFVGGSIVSDGTQTLASAKARKNAEINAARLAANHSTFPFAGKDIACDPLSRGDIDATTGIVTLTGALPPGWPGAWKAVSNDYVTIATLTDWAQFYGAMVAQGMTNFGRAQTRKAAIAAATTVEQVAAIVW